MFTLSTRLTVAVAGGAALMLAAPLTAGAAPAQHTESAASAAAAPITILAGNRGGFHHNGDPRQGTIQVAISVQISKAANGRIVQRGTAKLNKISKAVTIQIDRVTFQSVGESPASSAQNTNAVNSGAQGTINLSTPWVDTTNAEPNCCEPAGYNASVDYSVRWSDGTLTRGVLGASDAIDTQDVTPELRPPYTGTEKFSASTVVNRNNNPALGSVKLDAGMRVYKGAIQPYATMTKVSKAAQVQIDGVEAIGYSAEAATPPNPNYPKGAWPYNRGARSSGTAGWVSLSTAITSIKPTIDTTWYDHAKSFKVAVYYTIRWTDGKVTTGTYLTPLGKNSAEFPEAQGF